MTARHLLLVLLAIVAAFLGGLALGLTASASTSRPVQQSAPISTWYAWRPGEAAAGPALRRALGPGWRGSVVTVCAARCTVVRLTDWCACGSRHGVSTVIDLDVRTFAQLAPTSRGVIRVEVRR